MLADPALLPPVAERFVSLEQRLAAAHSIPPNRDAAVRSEANLSDIPLSLTVKFGTVGGKKCLAIDPTYVDGDERRESVLLKAPQGESVALEVGSLSGRIYRLEMRGVDVTLPQVEDLFREGLAECVRRLINGRPVPPSKRAAILAMAHLMQAVLPSFFERMRSDIAKQG